MTRKEKEAKKVRNVRNENILKSRKGNRKKKQDAKAAKPSKYVGKRHSLKGLKWVEHTTERPSFPKTDKKKLRAAQIAGFAYENKVGEYLLARYGEDRVLHGPWLRYEDERGVGWAQPDYVVLPDGDDAPLLIIEVKLSYTKTAAERKLKSIYKPLCERVWPNENGYRVVQACKNLIPDMPRDFVIKNIGDAYDDCYYRIWHYRPIV